MRPRLTILAALFLLAGPACGDTFGGSSFGVNDTGGGDVVGPGDTSADADQTTGAPDEDAPADADPQGDAAPVDDVADVAPADTGPAPDTSVEDATPIAGPPMTVGTWNLRNFSAYGQSEFRLADIAAKIDELSPDVLGLQELKLQDGTSGAEPQAWDGLLDALPDYAGVHAPWDVNDTTVGILVRKDVGEILDSDALFELDWYAFPRPPLRVDVRVTRGGESVEIEVIVLHLKAFGDSWERRLEACQKLHAWLANRPETTTVIVGDLNDDPYDTAEENNVFTGTFLGTEPEWRFVTLAFPPDASTSTGWFHVVDGKTIDGELIDHIIVRRPIWDAYASITPVIHGVPPWEHGAWTNTYSDHFPVIATFTP